MKKHRGHSTGGATSWALRQVLNMDGRLFDGYLRALGIPKPKPYKTISAANVRRLVAAVAVRKLQRATQKARRQSLKSELNQN